MNWLKVVLADKKITNKWLEKHLGKDLDINSKCCTNTFQPNIGSLMDFAELLEEKVTELLRLNKYGINI